MKNLFLTLLALVPVTTGFVVAQSSTLTQPSQEVAPAGRLLNLSTRGVVTADQGLIAGFAVSATGQGKKLILRAVGPSLSLFGVTNPLQQPVLRIYDQSGRTYENGYVYPPVVGGPTYESDLASSLARTGAFPLPAGTRDVVVMLPFIPGSYTAQVTSGDGTAGAVLLETLRGSLSERGRPRSRAQKRFASARPPATLGENTMPAAIPPSSSRLITFRNAFISGALMVAPLVVTIWAFRTIINLVGGTFRPLYESYLPDSLQRLPFFWDLVATLAVILLVTLLGYLSNYVFGKYFLSIGERLIGRIPGVSTLYNSVKQIVTTFGTQNRNLFSKVVLVEFPRKGVWGIGFLTNKQQGEPHGLTAGESWTIFVPTTPNPTSGFLILVPRQEVVELEMSVGDGMKMIISGGAVIPNWPPTEPAAVGSS